VEIFRVDDWDGFGEEVDEADDYCTKNRGGSDDRLCEEETYRQSEGSLGEFLYSRERGSFDSDISAACLLFDLLYFLAEHLRWSGLTHGDAQQGQDATRDSCYDEDPSPGVIISTRSFGI